MLAKLQTTPGRFLDWDWLCLDERTKTSPEQARGFGGSTDLLNLLRDASQAPMDAHEHFVVIAT